MPPVLTDLCYQFGETGVLLNQDNVQLPFIDVQTVQGLDSAPFRESEKDTEGVDGGVVEAEFETIRTIIVEGTIYATPTTIFDMLDSMKGNFGPSTVSQPFYFKMPSQSQRFVWCKSLGMRYDLNAAIRLATTAFQITLKAYDPTIYSSVQFSISKGLPPPATQGRGYPRIYPLGYGGVSNSGIISITNSGNKPVGAIMKIPGPVANPKILSDTEDGKFLQVLITLGATDVLTIDTGARTVFLNGTGNRRGLLAPLSEWFLLQPGVNNLRYSAATQTSSQLEVDWRDGYR
jgi:hypothetical protein